MQKYAENIPFSKTGPRLVTHQFISGYFTQTWWHLRLLSILSILFFWPSSTIFGFFGAISAQFGTFQSYLPYRVILQPKIAKMAKKWSITVQNGQKATNGGQKCSQKADRGQKLCMGLCFLWTKKSWKKIFSKIKLCDSFLSFAEICSTSRKSQKKCSNLPQKILLGKIVVDPWSQWFISHLHFNPFWVPAGQFLATVAPHGGVHKKNWWPTPIHIFSPKIRCSKYIHNNKRSAAHKGLKWPKKTKNGPKRNEASKQHAMAQIDPKKVW